MRAESLFTEDEVARYQYEQAEKARRDHINSINHATKIGLEKGIQQGIQPVSYTHLDVYKRQIKMLLPLGVFIFPAMFIVTLLPALLNLMNGFKGMFGR